MEINMVRWLKDNQDDGLPLVSVVIPTRNRVTLLQRAIESALAQTYQQIEIIVVIDGPDLATEAYIQTMRDSKVQFFPLSMPAGGSGARNAGVRAAKGAWIAFLDDDDIWMPTKLAKQLALAQDSGNNNVVVACKIIGRYPRQDYIWPMRFPNEGEPLCEYLFNRRTWFRGEGQLQTSMIFVTRNLMLQYPFREGLSKHQDTDWYVRVATEPGVRFVFAEEPLAIWYLGEHRESIVSRFDWKRSWRWLLSVRPFLTRRSFAGFIASQLVGEAAAQKRALRAAPFLFFKMITMGKPGVMDFILFFGNSLLSPTARGQLRRLLSDSRG